MHNSQLTTRKIPLAEIKDTLKFSFHRERVSSLHGVSPYIGRTRPEVARWLIRNFSKKGDTIWEPFVGAGTIALEGQHLGRHMLCCDVNPYAVCITKAKLNPPKSLQIALRDLAASLNDLETRAIKYKDNNVPQWVRKFYHPSTLREILAARDFLRENKKDFFLACLLGLLHHQRRGFLSYPSSNLTPYLRNKLYPRKQYPELYQYRALRPRLEAKVMRMIDNTKRNQGRAQVIQEDARLAPYKSGTANVIITSPPYMDRLSYARDNRLRLWFLGYPDHNKLERKYNLAGATFFSHFDQFLNNAKRILKPKGKIVLVLGGLAAGKSAKLRTKKSIASSLKQHLIASNSGVRILHHYRIPFPRPMRLHKNGPGLRYEDVLILKKTT